MIVNDDNGRYNRALDERQRRRDFVQQHDLIERAARQHTLDRKRTAEERTFRTAMRPYAPHTASDAEHEALVSDVLRESMLRMRASHLQACHAAGITSSAEADSLWKRRVSADALSTALSQAGAPRPVAPVAPARPAATAAAAPPPTAAAKPTPGSMQSPAAAAAAARAAATANGKAKELLSSAEARACFVIGLLASQYAPDRAAPPSRARHASPLRRASSPQPAAPPPRLSSPPRLLSATGWRAAAPPTPRRRRLPSTAGTWRGSACCSPRMRAAAASASPSRATFSSPSWTRAAPSCCGNTVSGPAGSPPRSRGCASSSHTIRILFAGGLDRQRRRCVRASLGCCSKRQCHLSPARSPAAGCRLLWSPVSLSCSVARGVAVTAEGARRRSRGGASARATRAVPCTQHRARHARHRMP